VFSRTSPIAALEVYDPQLICRYYRWRLPQVIGRALTILWSFLWFVLCLRWDQLWGHTDRNVGRRSVQLRKLLTDLGPTFIKVGQALSTRPDLVRKDYLEELTQLQDQLPPFPSEQAFARIESELGRPIAEIFAQISPEPVAAASLGQVYKAQLHSGEWVAVKVQRPHLREQLSLDLYLIRWASTWLGPWLPLNLGSTLTAVVDEFGRKLFEEIDYLHEGRNCERFAEYFRDDPDVYVPRIFWAYSTRRVLTLEWIDGIKLTDVERIRAANLEVKQLVRIGVVAALKQLLEYGFFHADPHPGNLFALTDGRMAYIDFGMMDQLTEEMKEYLVDALVHLVDRDYNALIDDFVHLGFLQPDVSRQELIRALEKVLADVLTQEVGNFNFKTATDQFSDLMYRYPFQSALPLCSGDPLFGHPRGSSPQPLSPVPHRRCGLSLCGQAPADGRIAAYSPTAAASVDQRRQVPLEPPGEPDSNCPQRWGTGLVAHRPNGLALPDVGRGPRSASPVGAFPHRR
jgi:predicted unusual protein kinase regulating ubiquinone biosynthesis (AarF/ABC1/UbiB family)